MNDRTQGSAKQLSSSTSCFALVSYQLPGILMISHILVRRAKHYDSRSDQFWSGATLCAIPRMIHSSRSSECPRCCENETLSSDICMAYSLNAVTSSYHMGRNKWLSLMQNLAKWTRLVFV